MSILSKLFGGGRKAPEVEAIEYNGFRIYPDPVSEQGQFRLAGRIEKGEGESLRVHTLVRADLIRDRDDACEAMVYKAKQMIDQIGDRVFDQGA